MNHQNKLAKCREENTLTLIFLTKQKIQPYTVWIQVFFFYRSEMNLITSFKLDKNWIKVTRTVLVCHHSHLWFDPNKLSDHRLRCENIMALQAVFTHSSWPALCLYSPVKSSDKFMGSSVRRSSKNFESVSMCWLDTILIPLNTKSGIGRASVLVNSWNTSFHFLGIWIHWQHLTVLLVLRVTELHRSETRDSGPTVTDQ